MNFFVLCMLFAIAYGKPSEGFYNPSFQPIIDEVNSKQTTWKAGHNFDKNVDQKHLELLCGTYIEDPLRASLPGEFLKALFKFAR